MIVVDFSKAKADKIGCCVCCDMVKRHDHPFTLRSVVSVIVSSVNGLVS